MIDQSSPEQVSTPERGWIDAVDGHFRVPDGPGLGVEPDPDVIRAYRVEGS